MFNEGFEITLACTPSHLRIPANEKADLFAKRACKEGLQINHKLHYSDLQQNSTSLIKYDFKYFLASYNPDTGMQCMNNYLSKIFLTLYLLSNLKRK